MVARTGLGWAGDFVRKVADSVVLVGGDSDALADRIVTFFGDNLGPVLSDNILKSTAQSSGHQLADSIEEMMRKSP